MNYLNRAKASMTRRLGKTIILLLLVFVLGNVISGAISIRTAVQNTDANLRAQLPAVATIVNDWEAENAAWNRGEQPEWVPLTADDIRAVAALPYVQQYNMSMDHQLMSTELERYWNPFTQEGQTWEDEDWNSTLHQGGEFEQHTVRGVNVPELFEIQSGNMELVAGHLFTDAQMSNGEMVAIISEGFAEQNNLQVGDTLPLSSKVLDWGMGGMWGEIFVEENVLAERDWELEVVGILSFLLEPTEGEDVWQINHTKSSVENRITIPFSTLETIIRAELEMNLEVNPELMEGMDVDNIEESFWFSSMFYLSDPAYLQPFAEAANEILSGFWIISDLSNTFGDIAGSMETMLMISNIVLGVSVGATLVILSLLITLFLRDRKHEIGIYLALGERKGRVITQILIEVMSTAMVAVAISLFTGSLLSSNISQQMLENDLRQRQEDSWMMGSSWSSGDMELAMFSPGEMSFEDMLAAYDTSLDGTTVSLFFGVAIVTILVSTLAPMLYVVRLNPKKIMM